MLTISKFSHSCLLCLCGDREYRSSFQNKLVSSSFKWVPKYILFPAKLKRKGRPFLNGKAYTYPISYLLHVGVTLTIIYVFIILLLFVGIENNFAIFKINQYTLLLIEYPGIFSSWTNWRRKEGLFWRVQEGGPHCEITSKSTWLSQEMKRSILLWNLK